MKSVGGFDSAINFLASLTFEEVKSVFSEPVSFLSVGFHSSGKVKSCGLRSGESGLATS